jgi:hypothetical protein
MRIILALVVAAALTAAVGVSPAAASRGGGGPQPIACATCGGGGSAGCTSALNNFNHGGDWSGSWTWNLQVSWCWNSSGWVSNVSVNSYPSVSGAYGFDGSDGIIYANRDANGSYAVETQGRFHWFDPVGAHFTADSCVRMFANGSAYMQWSTSRQVTC